MPRVPVHVISGFLGAGKTTMLIDQLARRQGRERCAIIVNDFGEARIDATLLSGGVAVAEIAGGCVCCTAPEALVPNLTTILREVRPDRVFIESTGLARPADIVDTLRRSPLGDELELAPTVIVLDPRRLVTAPPTLLLEQLDAADVVIASHADQSTAAGDAALRAQLRDHYPPPLAVAQSSFGVVDEAVFDLRRDRPLPFIHDDHDHDHAHHDHDHTRRAPSTEGWSAGSRVWPPERVFSAAGIRRALQAATVERVKGLFRTDLGWYRADRANGAVRVVVSPVRSGSAVDVIHHGPQEEVNQLLAALDACISDDAHLKPPDEPVVTLVDVQGRVVELTRFALAALPGQVADVAAAVPGRVGAAVSLGEVLALTFPSPDDQLVLVATDGLTTAPVRVEEAEAALLVHSLSGEPLPSAQGGPFRVLVPKGQSGCANVKGLARIVLVAAGAVEATPG
ncbi:molybdopterin-dependent oxidoreductase [Myxococcota bacterium]|nr:molybdopterin-dependent oxidoreductase [Myxococcota bacterium]